MTEILITTMLQLSVVATVGQNYDDAYRQSQETGRPLLVLVGADWCPACHKMNLGVVPELRRRGVLENVHFAKVNIDQDKALVEKLSQSTVVPQLILYKKTGEGWRRWKMTGQKSLEDVEAFLAKEPQETVATKPQEKLR